VRAFLLFLRSFLNFFLGASSFNSFFSGMLWSVPRNFTFVSYFVIGEAVIGYGIFTARHFTRFCTPFSLKRCIKAFFSFIIQLFEPGIDDIRTNKFVAFLLYLLKSMVWFTFLSKKRTNKESFTDILSTFRESSSLKNEFFPSDNKKYFFLASKNRMCSFFFQYKAWE